MEITWRTKQKGHKHNIIIKRKKQTEITQSACVRLGIIEFVTNGVNNKGANTQGSKIFM